MSAESTLWNQCLRVLKAELPEQQFNTWIRPLQAVDDGTVLQLLAPNRFVVDWLKQHHIQRLLQLVADHGAGTELLIEVGSRPARSAETAASGRPKAAPIKVSASACEKPGIVANEQANQSPSNSNPTPETRCPQK